MELNKRLAALRKERGLSQTEAAEQLNISRQSISKWESGIAIPTTENLLALSTLYGLTLDELLHGGIGSPSPAAPPERERPAAPSRRRQIGYFIVLSVLLLGIGILIGYHLAGMPDRYSTDDMNNTVLDPNSEHGTFDLEWGSP